MPSYGIVGEAQRCTELPQPWLTNAAAPSWALHSRIRPRGDYLFGDRSVRVLRSRGPPPRDDV